MDVVDFRHPDRCREPRGPVLHAIAEQGSKRESFTARPPGCRSDDGIDEVAALDRARLVAESGSGSVADESRKRV
ncbi:MAG: hypothetical protein ACM30I_05070 [Gemmatimonas sp.]